MKWIEKILGKAIFFKEGKKGWEDIVEIVEDIGICSCFPANFENKEDSMKARLYADFKNKIGIEIYKENRQAYLQQCNGYVEWEMQREKYNLRELGKSKAYKQ